MKSTSHLHKTVAHGILCLVMLTAVPATPSLASENQHKGGGYIRQSLDDGAYLVTAPLRLQRQDLPYVAAGGSLLVGTMMLDRTVRHHLFPWSARDPATDLRDFGNYAQFSGPAIGTLFALHAGLTGDSKSKETAFLSYEAFIWSSAIEGGLKFAIGRRRPITTDHPFRFTPGKGDQAMPSGHTTVAFAAATVLSEQYPSAWVAIPAYGVAGIVGFSRLYANQHWASDVLTGAVLGTAVAHALRRKHRQRNDIGWNFDFQLGSVRLTRSF